MGEGEPVAEGEGDVWHPRKLKGSKRLLVVMGLSVFSTLIELIAAFFLSSNIILANVFDGSYEIILLFINYKGMIYEENGRRKAAIRFANTTDILLVLGCLMVLISSIRAWYHPHSINGLAIASVSALSVLINLWAWRICPKCGYNGKSAFIKVMGGTVLVIVGCLGGLLMWAFSWYQFDALAGGLISLILGGYVTYNLRKRSTAEN